MSLRTELIESQKVRSDLLKWKLLIVAVVGGAALGFSGNGEPGRVGQSALALAILPIVCAYVDLLCRHLSLRNKIIGLYLEYSGSAPHELRHYEVFYRDLADELWNGRSLESWALLWSTVFVSAAVAPVGIVASGGSWWPGTWPNTLFYCSSLLGLLLALLIQFTYRRWKAEATERAKAIIARAEALVTESES